MFLSRNIYSQFYFEIFAFPLARCGPTKCEYHLSGPAEVHRRQIEMVNSERGVARCRLDPMLPAIDCPTDNRRIMQFEAEIFPARQLLNFVAETPGGEGGLSFFFEVPLDGYVRGDVSLSIPQRPA